MLQIAVNLILIIITTWIFIQQTDIIRDFELEQLYESTKTKAQKKAERKEEKAKEEDVQPEEDKKTKWNNNGRIKMYSCVGFFVCAYRSIETMVFCHIRLVIIVCINNSYIYNTFRKKLLKIPDSNLTSCN